MIRVSLMTLAAIFTIAAATLATSGPATAALATSGQAQGDDNNDADVRCLVVALDMSRSPDRQMRSLATSAGLYFVGRLRGRTPDLDMEAAIVRQLRVMTHDDLLSEGRRCGGILASQADRLAALGEHLRGMTTLAPALPPAPDAAPPK